MQLRSLLWALCLLWANSVSMTESGNLELRPWVPGSGFCDKNSPLKARIFEKKNFLEKMGEPFNSGRPRVLESQY